MKTKLFCLSLSVFLSVLASPGQSTNRL